MDDFLEGETAHAQEPFDPSDLRQVGDALQRFEQRCVAIVDRLSEGHCLASPKREEILAIYRALKKDLSALALTGMLPGRRGRRSRAEDCFFHPAVQRAALRLVPAANPKLIGSAWMIAVLAAQMEFSYYRRQLTRFIERQAPAAPGCEQPGTSLVPGRRLAHGQSNGEP